MSRHHADSSGPPDRTVKAIETMDSILSLIKRSDGASLTTIARELDLAKSTVHRYLQTMLEREYIIREGDEYYLSMRFLGFAEAAKTRKPAYSLVQEKIDLIAEETGERVQFVVEEHGKVTYVHRSIGAHGVTIGPKAGESFSLHATASGKAILSALDDTEIQAYLDQHELAPVTEQTITTPEELWEEVEFGHQAGFNMNREESMLGLNAVAVPVIGAGEEVLGALSIAGPSHRLTDSYLTEELPSLLLGYANELELNLRE